VIEEAVLRYRVCDAQILHDQLLHLQEFARLTDRVVPAGGGEPGAVGGRSRPQSRLLVVEGAGHGFSIAGDKAYRQPQTLAFQAQVIDAIIGWVLPADQPSSPH
jgi:hypothetical protein